MKHIGVFAREFSMMKTFINGPEDIFAMGTRRDPVGIDFISKEITVSNDVKEKFMFHHQFLTTQFQLGLHLFAKMTSAIIFLVNPDSHDEVDCARRFSERLKEINRGAICIQVEIKDGNQFSMSAESVVYKLLHLEKSRNLIGANAFSPILSNSEGDHLLNEHLVESILEYLVPGKNTAERKININSIFASQQQRAAKQKSQLVVGNQPIDQNQLGVTKSIS